MAKVVGEHEPIDLAGYCYPAQPGTLAPLTVNLHGEGDDQFLPLCRTPAECLVITNRIICLTGLRQCFITARLPRDQSVIVKFVRALHECGVRTMIDPVIHSPERTTWKEIPRT